MKTLMIPKLATVHYHSSFEDIATALAPLAGSTIEEIPWPDYSYKPFAHVKIAYTADSLLLHFSVNEKHIRAKYRNTNDPVYRDSCVEFFISFDTVNYYNLEFNCLGTALVGYGTTDKSKRGLLQKEVIEQIKTHAVIKSESGVAITWQLLLNIPLNLFETSGIHTLSDVQCTGNFFKCGDDLPTPHFVAWNNIDYPTPNFHLPQFFGNLHFLS